MEKWNMWGPFTDVASERGVRSTLLPSSTRVLSGLCSHSVLSQGTGKASLMCIWQFSLRSAGVGAAVGAQVTGHKAVFWRCHTLWLPCAVVGTASKQSWQCRCSDIYPGKAALLISRWVEAPVLFSLLGNDKCVISAVSHYISILFSFAPH